MQSASASTAKAISVPSRAPKSSPTLCGRSRSPECLGLTGRLATSLTFFFTFQFQESELVRGVTHYAQLQPTTDISIP